MLSLLLIVLLVVVDGCIALKATVLEGMGFLGSRVVCKLVEQGAEVRSVSHADALTPHRCDLITGSSVSTPLNYSIWPHFVPTSFLHNTSP
jgi:hypothetical protein